MEKNLKKRETFI